MNKERERMEYLISQKFISPEQLSELDGNDFVVEVEDCGRSGQYNGFTWFNVRVITEGYLPDDEDYPTTRHSIYVKYEE